MTDQTTINKLIEMRFTAMADALRIQMQDYSLDHLSFEERQDFWSILSIPVEKTTV
jgi:hypothetical protein